jgi:hypothetical protein
MTCSTGRTKLTVADFTSFCGLLDCLYYLGDDIGLDNQLDFFHLFLSSSTLSFSGCRCGQAPKLVVDFILRSDGPLPESSH